ncbi:MAG TPA: DUF3515 domain-containing protein [Corynebacterium sp.]|nr:DUF3515 domain-containing protein [Corynebacterium sp.]HHT31795.1 DUF3515 domain-containing protein [Corynebacterium sp.]
MGENVQAQGNRRRAGIALALAVLLTLGVIIGAKLFQDDQARNPVSLSAPDMPDDDSPKCAELLDRLPDRLDGLVRAELAEPAPIGAAVWRNTADERVTLRCGASVPVQYTDLSVTEEHDGVKWVRINDTTEGSTLATWFAIGRTPVVAVTADASRADAIPGLSEAMLPDSEVGDAPAPNPVPLTDLAADEADDRCSALMAALPTEIGERKRVEDADLPAGSMVWADGIGNLISLRCGVDAPAGYADTEEQLTQINDIVWFSEPSLSSGDVGTWYAMGRERFVAVHLPVGEASGVLPALSEIISANLKNISPSEQ